MLEIVGRARSLNFTIGVLLAALALAPGATPAAEAPKEVKIGRGGRLFSALRFDIPAAGGGVQPIFLVEPAKPEGEKRAILLIGGGRGRVNHVRKWGEGRYRLSRNFLMRIVGHIVAEGIAAVPVGMWSGLEDGAGDAFRLGEGNAKNMAAAVRILAARGYAEIFVAGTSRGTMDAANLALNLRHRRVKGIMFTSTMGGSEGISGLPLEKISYPVLFIHNRRDKCRVTTYGNAREMFGRIKESPRRQFVTVDAAAEGWACSAKSAHGFWGVEGKVARAMTDWAKGGVPPDVIK